MVNTKEDKKGSIDFLMHHSKKFMIFLIIVALLTAVAAAGAAFLWGGDAVATLGNKKVTKTEYDDATTKCASFYQYNKDESSKKKCSESQIEDLVMTKALETEAEKRGITVTNDEITKKYNVLVAAYKDEAEYKATIKQAYGWDTDYVKGNLRRDILKEKLTPFLLNTKDVSGVFVRYDWAQGNISGDREAIAKSKLESSFAVLMKKGANDEEILKEREALMTEYPWNGDSNTGIMKYRGLSATDEKKRFEGREDWQAISKLKKVGDVTEAVRSSGGYYAIYRLTATTTGNFNDWDEFQQLAIKKSKISLVSYNYHNFKREAEKNVKQLSGIVGRMLKIETANAEVIRCDVPRDQYYCEICSGGHASSVIGRVLDGGNTSLALADVSLNGSLADNFDAGTTQPFGIHPSCYVTHDGSPDTWPQLDRVSCMSGSDGRFTMGGDGIQLSCWIRWDIFVSKTKYKTIKYGSKKLAVNGGSDNLDDGLISWSNVMEDYTGDYAAENTDNDGDIYLALDPPRGWHDSVNGEIENNDWTTAFANLSDLTDNGYDTTAGADNSCNVTLGWACDPEDFNYQSGIYLYQTPSTTEWDSGSHLTTTLSAANIARNSNYSFGNACGGSMSHAFVYRLPESIKDGTTHYIWAYAFSKDGSPYKLDGTPIAVTCEPPVIVNNSCILSASPQSIQQGESVSLNATGTLKPPYTVTAAGSSDIVTSMLPISVMPSANTTYKLTDSSSPPSICLTNVKVTPHQSGSEKPVPPN